MPLDQVAEQLFDYIRDLIYDFDNAVLDVDTLPDTHQVLGESMVHLGELIKEVRELTRDISDGNLTTDPISVGNTLGVDLKILQSMLRRLAFSLEKVAGGDYDVTFITYSSVSTQLAKVVKELKTNKQKLQEQAAQNQNLSEALFQSNSLFEAVTSSSIQWIIIVEQSTKEWLFSNRSPEKILNSAPAEERLLDWLDNKIEGLSKGIDEIGSQTISMNIGEKELGIPRYFVATIYPLNWHGHQSIAFVFNDITESKIKLDKLEAIAYYDELTKTYNRHKGMEILDRMVDEHVPFVVCFVDLDDLKYINDVYGHNLGDDYIKTVANLLTEFDGNATVCRLGGDEFMLLAKGWNSKDANARFEEMRARLYQASLDSKQLAEASCADGVQAADDQKFYSISYGVVEVGIDNEFSASYLLASADDKMYEYKRAKKLARRCS